MPRKLMFEATHAVVDGNTVVIESGQLFASRDEVPEGVQVVPVEVNVDDQPPTAPEPEPAKPAESEAKSEPPKPPAKTPVK